MTATIYVEATEPLAAAKGWYADPRGQHDLRYHDGQEWTEHVTHFGPVPCRGCTPEVTRQR